MSEPKNQELPPLIQESLDLPELPDAVFGDRQDNDFHSAFEARNSQLLAAIAENELLRTESKAKDARIAELERTNTWIADKRALKMWTERAESAEQRLRAVSERLKKFQPDHDPFAIELFEQLRAIVEGK